MLCISAACSTWIPGKRVSNLSSRVDRIGVRISNRNGIRELKGPYWRHFGGGESAVTSFESIYVEHGDYVRRTIRKIALRFYDFATAEDVEQEVWLSLHLQLRRGIDSLFNPRAWLNMVIRRKFIDLGWRTKTRKRLLPMLTSEEINERNRAAYVEGATLWEKVPSTVGCPEVEHERMEMRERIQQTLNEVNPRYRKALVLREIQGCSYKQIGKVMRTNVSGVETLIWRARKKFREAYVKQVVSEEWTI